MHWTDIFTRRLLYAFYSFFLISEKYSKRWNNLNKNFNFSENKQQIFIRGDKNVLF